MIYNEKSVKITRLMCIVQSALEYFIALGVGSTYIPKIGAMLGMSESGQIILTSCVSLGFAFNFISLFLAEIKPVKPWIIPLHILNQVFFSLVWFVPAIRISNTVKVVLFVVFYIIASMILNVCYAPTWTWYYSMVDMDKRGRFTAVKEMVSLIGGMLFTVVFSRVYDSLGEENPMAYIVCGIIILSIAIVHAVSLFVSVEKPIDKSTINKEKPKLNIKDVITNKPLIKIVVFEGFWKIVMYVTTAFFAVFQYSVMNMSVATIGLITAISCILRAVFSIPIGKVGDKKSFPVQFNVCFVIEIVAMLAIVLYVPQWDNIFSEIKGIGLVFPTLICFIYYGCYQVGLVGLENGFNNLLYDYIGEDMRTQSIAVKNTVVGLVSFLCTIVFTKIKELYDMSKLVIFGTTVEFIQLAAFISIIVIILLMIYNYKVIMKMKKEF